MLGEEDSRPLPFLFYSNQMKRLILIILMLGAWAAKDMSAQTFSVKTSLTMLATTTPNIEVSVPLGKKVSLHLPVLYNPWVFKENSRFQQLTTMPGVRIWQQQCGVHYFYSVYGIASRFHFGGWMDRKFRYDGTAYGAGGGAGYSIVLNDHWNIDFEGGVGLVWAEYDKCGWQKDSHRYGSYKRLKFIPTKLDVSFVYFF